MDDGQPGVFEVGGGVDVPELSIQTTPPIAMSDPRVLAGVIGQPFHTHRARTAEGHRATSYATSLDAPIRADEVSGIRLDVLARRDPSGGTMFSLV
jgi:hypothetical protein